MATLEERIGIFLNCRTHAHRSGKEPLLSPNCEARSFCSKSAPAIKVTEWPERLMCSLK